MLFNDFKDLHPLNKLAALVILVVEKSGNAILSRASQFVIKPLKLLIPEPNTKCDISKVFKDLQKNIDKALQKGLIKENKVDREKQRLNTKIKNMK